MSEWTRWAFLPDCPFCGEQLVDDSSEAMEALGQRNRGLIECGHCGYDVEVEAEFEVTFRARPAPPNEPHGPVWDHCESCGGDHPPQQGDSCPECGDENCLVAIETGPAPTPERGATE